MRLQRIRVRGETKQRFKERETHAVYRDAPASIEDAHDQQSQQGRLEERVFEPGRQASWWDKVKAKMKKE